MEIVKVKEAASGLRMGVVKVRTLIIIISNLVANSKEGEVDDEKEDLVAEQHMGHEGDQGEPEEEEVDDVGNDQEKIMIVNHLALVMLGLLQGNKQTMGGEPIGKRILCSLQCGQLVKMLICEYDDSHIKS